METQIISADDIERIILDVYQEQDRNRMIINDDSFVMVSPTELEKIIKRNSVKHKPTTQKYQCEERALDLLVQIRTDPDLYELQYNICIGMSGGRLLRGLDAGGKHMMLLAISLGHIIYEIEPKTDSVYPANPKVFSAFNLWM